VAQITPVSMRHASLVQKDNPAGRKFTFTAARAPAPSSAARGPANSRSSGPKTGTGTQRKLGSLLGVLRGSGIESRGPAGEDQLLRRAAEEMVARSALGQ
jgi:hypothetical protein